MKYEEMFYLQNFLNRMGAKVEGAGTHVIKIKGVQVHQLLN